LKKRELYSLLRIGLEIAGLARLDYAWPIVDFERAATALLSRAASESVEGRGLRVEEGGQEVVRVAVDSTVGEAQRGD
jgi:hypothetical protein